MDHKHLDQLDIAVELQYLTKDWWYIVKFLNVIRHP